MGVITEPQPTHFKSYLQREFVRRCKSNPRYSMRAFAESIGVDNSRLSKIFRNQRPLSAELIQKIGERLNLSTKEISKFCQNAQAPTKIAPVADHDYQELTLDAFEIIEDWHHYAILELMKLDDFLPSQEWLMKKLSLNATQVQLYIERLQRVHLLKIHEDGSWEDTSGGFTTHILGPNLTTQAHRKSQREILELAIQKLNLPIEQRDQSSMMMATSTEKLDEAKKMIKNFRRELCAFLEDTETKDTVYQLSVSLFPLIDEEKT